jgi:hypothetical protein
MRRLPHQGARHSTAGHGNASDGVFPLLHLGASFELSDPPPKISLLSLSLCCGWPIGVNGSLLCEWRRLHTLRVEDPSGARKGRPNQPWEWSRLAVLG